MREIDKSKPPPAQARSLTKSVARKLNVHLTDRRTDRYEQGTDVALEEMSDVTDAEAIDVRHLAGVDHESLVVQPPVEILKLKVWMLRIAESGDDRALQLGPQVFGEPHFAHPGDQRLIIGTVACGSSLDSSFGLQLVERLLERQDRVRSRCKAKLSAYIHLLPLGKQIEA